MLEKQKKKTNLKSAYQDKLTFKHFSSSFTFTPVIYLHKNTGRSRWEKSVQRPFYEQFKSLLTFYILFGNSLGGWEHVPLTEQHWRTLRSTQLHARPNKIQHKRRKYLEMTSVLITSSVSYWSWSQFIAKCKLDPLVRNIFHGSSYQMKSN
jgi:hypothetical protein